MNKKGIELSINFIVTLILALVIFSFSILFVQKFFVGAGDIQESLDSQTREELQSRLFASSEEVIIFPSSLTIKPREGKFFGVGVLNLGGETIIDVSAVFSKCFDERGKELSDQGKCLENINVIGDPQKKILANDREIFEKLVTIARSAPSGIYAITVQVNGLQTSSDGAQRTVHVTVP